MLNDNEKILKIRHLLKVHPRGLSISSIAQKLKINRNSLAKYLEILLVTGQVEMRTYGVAKVYYLTSRVPLSAMMKFAAELIIVLDDHKTVIQANDNFLSFFGLRREDLVGTNISALSQLPFSDFPFQSLIEETHRTGELIKEVRVKKDKNEVQFKVKFVSTVFDDGAHGITIFFEDITQQKEYEQQLQENEARYRAVVEDQTELISRFLPDGAHIFVNEAYCRYFQKKREDLLGHRFTPAIPPEDLQRLKTHFLSLTPEHPVATIDHRVILPDRQVRWHRWRDHALFDQNGTLAEYQSLGNDITEQKHVEDLVRIQRDLAIVLSSTNDLQEALRMILDYVLQIENVDSGGIYSVDNSTMEIHLLASKGFSSQFIQRIGHFNTESPLSGLVQKGIPVYTRFDELSHSVDNICRGEGLRAFALIPVYAEGKIIASLNLASRTSDDFPPNTQRALEAIAAQIGGVIVRVKVGEELKKSEERYKTLAESAQDAIYTLTTDGILTYMNTSGAAMLGVSPEQIVGLPIEKLFPLTVAEEFQTKMKDAVSLKKPIRHETKIEYGNHILWLDAQIVPQIGPDGSIVQMIGISRDITLHKKAEDALRESEEKYRVLVETSRDGILIIDFNGVITFANTAAVKMYNLDTPKDVVGMSVFDIVTPEFRQSVLNNIQKVQQGVESFFSTYRGISATGREVWVECHSVILTYQGRPAIMVSLRDITAKRQAEKDLRIKDSAIESSINGIAIFDLEGKFIYGNRAFLNIVGVENPQEIIGKPLDWFAPGDKHLLDTIQSGIVGIAQTGGWTREVHYRKEDGSERYLQVSANEVKDENGVPICHMVSIADISTQRTAEERYQTTYEKLKDTIEFMPDPTFIVNRNKKVVAWNKALENFTGVKKETVLGTNDYRNAFPFYEGTRPILIDILDVSPQDLIIKYPQIRKFGNSIFIEAFIPTLHGGKGGSTWGKASALIDKDGNIIGAIESIRDISEWKRAEEFMRHSYDHLDQIMNKQKNNENSTKK